MKITVIGGGGVRSMFLAKSLAQRAQDLNITQIAFMDNNESKLFVYGQMAKEVAKRIDETVDFILTTDPIEAVKDADYIITTIRVGEDRMRVRDERTSLKAGVLGQETTGAAGFAFAMRSVPALVEYCELVKKYASPNAKVFNFTNPAGVVSQTLRDMGYDFTYGICDAPSGLLHSFAKLYGVKQEAITGNCYGLNHLSYFDSVKLNGKEIMHELIEDPRIYSKTDMRFFDKDFVRHMGLILNEYLYYYYSPEKAIDNILKADKTRGEIICDINEQMTMELSTMDPTKDFDGCLKVFDKWYGAREDAYMQNETGIKSAKDPFHFNIFEMDAGGYAGVALKYIEAEQSGTKADMIMCVPNQGAIPGLKDDDVVEISCTIDHGTYTTHKIAEGNDNALELIRRVKYYERLASKAIRNRDINTAIDCLMAHPLVNSYSLAKTLVEQFLDYNKDYIGGWS